MTRFRSSREKRLWLWSLIVLMTILSPLFIGQPLNSLLRDQSVQALIFSAGLLLVGVTILVYGIRANPGKLELSVLLGLVAIYVMLFFRLGTPERSHLIEYSVLSIFIHSALTERTGQGKQKIKQALVAFLITFLIGILDECIQLFIPHRVFDYQDILFNGIAAFLAIGSSLILAWIRKGVK